MSDHGGDTDWDPFDAEFDPWDPGSAEAHTEAVERASPLTFEGVIQGYGDLAQTAKHGTGWRRVTGWIVVIAVGLPAVVFVASGMLVVVARLVGVA